MLGAGAVAYDRASSLRHHLSISGKPSAQKVNAGVGVGVGSMFDDGDNIRY